MYNGISSVVGLNDLGGLFQLIKSWFCATIKVQHPSDKEACTRLRKHEMNFAFKRDHIRSYSDIAGLGLLCVFMCHQFIT